MAVDGYNHLRYYIFAFCLFMKSHQQNKSSSSNQLCSDTESRRHVFNGHRIYFVLFAKITSFVLNILGYFSIGCNIKG